jgi:hypothetical protein
MGRSPQVHLLGIADFVDSDIARSEALHFDRLVYKKVADAIRAAIEQRYEIASPLISTKFAAASMPLPALTS